MYWQHILCLIVALSSTIALPVKEKKEPELTDEQKKESLKNEPPVLQNWELSLEYSRYLKEVVQALESDPAFKKKLEQADAEDIKSGKIARELHFVDHNVRSKLDELKRRELERLRHYAMQEQDKKNGVDRSKLKIPVHIDHRNPTRFEVDDLKKLIQQTTHDLEQVDQQRKKDFTQYEMKKEYEYEHDLAKLTPEERKKAEEKHASELKKHKEHPKLHHPGSKQQLEEVWEEQDHMSKDDFDPNNFFHLHDLDGNGQWDETEVKTLFLKELDKMYDPNATEDDLMERQEEMERMREHIFTEADLNNDDLISHDEFLQQTRRNEFEQDEGWQGLDEQELYSQQEYDQYQQQRMVELQEAGVQIPHNAMPLPPHPAAYPVHPDMQPQYAGQVPMQQGYMGEVHPGQGHLGQVHPGQVPMGQVHPGQIPMGQMHPEQVQMGQMHPGQAPMGQIHHGQVPRGQMHPDQGPMGQVYPGQASMGPIHPGQAPMGQIHPGQAPMGQIHPGQAPMGQIHPGQAPMGQIHPGQAPMGQVNPGQAPMGQVNPGQAPMGQVNPGQAPMRQIPPVQGQFHPGQAEMGQLHPGQIPVSQIPAGYRGQGDGVKPIAGHEALPEGMPPNQEQQLPHQEQIPQEQQHQIPQEQQHQIPQEQQHQIPQEQQHQIPQQQQKHQKIPHKQPPAH